MLWAIIVAASIALLWYLNTKKEKFKNLSISPFGFLWKTKRFNKFFFPIKNIEKIADIGLYLGYGIIYVLYKHKKIQKRLFLSLITIPILFIIFKMLPFSRGPFAITAYFGAIFGFSGFVGSALILQTIDIFVKYFSKTTPCPGAAPVLPGVKIPGVDFYIPFLEGWIALFITMIIHEFGHAVVARTLRVKIDNSGLVFFGVVPVGAFVSINEEEMKKIDDQSKIRIFAMGPFINFIFFIIFSFLLLGISQLPYLKKVNENLFEGVFVKEVQKEINICGTKYESPAYGKIPEGAKILEINGKKIKSLQDIFKEKKGKQKIRIKYEINGKTYEKEIKMNKIGQIGVILEIKQKNQKPPLLYVLLSFLISVLFWTSTINLIASIGNYLPMPPFDGGQISSILLAGILPARDKEKQKKTIAITLFAIFLAILFMNFLPIILNPILKIFGWS